MRKLLLRQALSLSKLPQIERQYLSNLHAREGTLLQSISPRSILDKRNEQNAHSYASYRQKEVPLGLMLLFAVGTGPPQAGVGRVDEPDLQCDLRALRPLAS
jgi:hypothetical protein